MLKTPPLASRSNCGGTGDTVIWPASDELRPLRSWIAGMILSMCRKFSAALLILGWVSLFGFDVVGISMRFQAKSLFQALPRTTAPLQSEVDGDLSQTTSSSLQTAHNRVMLRSFVLPRLSLIPIRFSISEDTFNSINSTASF